MATPELAIAKATLSATLFRADPSSLSRPAVEDLFTLLSSALDQCSRQNVQKCKAWIVDHIAPSGARTAALAKFLVALSKSLEPNDGQKPSCKRRRLHMLYIINDVLYHVVIRYGDGKFATAWDGVLPGLIANAAAFENCPKHKKKLDDLISIWEEEQYFTPDTISNFRQALMNGVGSTPPIASHSSSASLKITKDTPYVLPSFHGDSSIPWYDLPAATWLPHFTPNSTRPMVPDLIRPIQLAPGPADKALADAVRNLLSGVDRLFAKGGNVGDDPQFDLNELGERVELDEVTGEVIGGETYYELDRGHGHGQAAQTVVGGRKAPRLQPSSAANSPPRTVHHEAAAGVATFDGAAHTAAVDLAAAPRTSGIRAVDLRADHPPEPLHRITAADRLSHQIPVPSGRHINHPILHTPTSHLSRRQATLLSRLLRLPGDIKGLGLLRLHQLWLAPWAGYQISQ